MRRVRDYFIHSGHRMWLLFFVVVALGLFDFSMVKGRNASAQNNPVISKPKMVDFSTKFVVNEILVKIKRDQLSKIGKGNKNQTGISTLSKQAAKFPVASFERLVAASDKDDISQWYKLTLKGPRKVVTGKFDKATDSMVSEDPEAREVGKLIKVLRHDAAVQAVEPNYVVLADQAVTPTPTPEGFMNITYPNGGEVVTAGDTVRITWASNLTSACNLVYVAEVTGPTIYYNISYPNARSGYFDWIAQIPASMSLPQRLKIAIICEGAPQDYSDDFFTVVSGATPIPSPSEIPSPTPIASAGTPNDPYYWSTGTWGQPYADMWGLKKINIDQAWLKSTGSTGVVVAGIDTGIDRNHPDIRDNIWINNLEVPGNGIDEDGNGYVDDVFGWNFVSGNGDPMDDHGHGTHTAGTIAAVGNNGQGVPGVNWQTKIMAVKFLNSGGSGVLDNGVKAIKYAVDNGAKVLSNSWGCNCQSEAIDDVIKFAHSRGAVVVAAAGNNGSDALDFSPASADFVIAVSASDPFDQRAYYPGWWASNWSEKLDVAAPGADILSLILSSGQGCWAGYSVGANYCRLYGTSMAAPHVSGLAALLLAHDSTLTSEEIRQLIRSGADDLGAGGKDPYFGFGRINAGRSLEMDSVKPLAPYILTPGSRTGISGTSYQIKGGVPGNNFSQYRVEVGLGRSPTSWTEVVVSDTQVISGILATIDTTQLAPSNYTIRLIATDTAGKTYQFQVFDVGVNFYEAYISDPVSSISAGFVPVAGTAQTLNGLGFSRYTLDWGLGAAPDSYSTAGVSLANGGTVPVINGSLGTWDTTALVPGQTYSLRLKVYGISGNPAISTNTVVFALPVTPTPVPTATASPTPLPTITPTPTLLPTITPTPTPRTISLRGVSTSTNTSKVRTFTINRPAGVEVGDVMLAQVTVRGATTTVTAPSGWQTIRTDKAGSDLVNSLYYRVASASEPTSYSWTLNRPQLASGGILDYVGADTASPVSANSGRYNKNTQTITAPSVTTSTANSKVVFITAAGTQTSVTPPAGFSPAYSSGVQGNLTSYVADQTVVSVGPIGNQVGTLGIKSNNVGALVVLRPAL